MFPYKKSILIISFILLIVLSACSQATVTSQPPESDRGETQLEMNIPQPANEPSPLMLPAEGQQETVKFEPCETEMGV